MNDLTPILDQLAQLIAQHLHHQHPQPPAGNENGDSPWLSVASAAQYLDWPRQRLYKLTASAAIPHYKHEGRLLFHRDELDTWLQTYARPARRALQRA